MTDIIWGNGVEVLSSSSFKLNVTHKKDGNKHDYQDHEIIKIISADLPGLPLDENNWDKEELKNCVNDAFLKCEIIQREESGIVLAKVSHSGVGGY